MYSLYPIRNYKTNLNLRETQKAIKIIKDNFCLALENNLHLERVSAPMLIKTSTGLNDDLSGIERSVKFDVKEMDGVIAEIVHSLAKWKRVALKNYKFGLYEGLYTDMNAIRRDDSLDNIHSIYVDQWDWEMVIDKKDRCFDFLKKIVKLLVKSLSDTFNILKKEYPSLTTVVCEDVYFLTTQELENMYPNLSLKDREREITKKYKTVFLMQIGDLLESGVSHDSRAPDYDDWKLNGDLLMWHNTLDSQIELSSMGIRVDADALKYQLEKSNKTERMKFNYHKMISENTLPLTIGGGIGQSRMCMYLLDKYHIGEVQSSIWPDEMLVECENMGVKIL